MIKQSTDNDRLRQSALAAMGGHLLPEVTAENFQWLCDDARKRGMSASKYLNMLLTAIQIQQRLGRDIIEHSLRAIHEPDENDDPHRRECAACGKDYWYLPGDPDICPRCEKLQRDEVDEVKL